MVDWKKDIKLSDVGRRKKDDEATPAEKSESVWKKEVSFRRRKPPVRDSGPVEGVRGNREVPSEEPAAEKTSVWKKEISFGRRKPPVRDSGPVEVPAEEPAAEQTSVWKKEISFKRKAKAEELLVLPPLPPVEESPPPAVDLPEPVQPETPEKSGNVTPVTAVTASDAVAASLNEPEPAGRKKSVLEPAFQYWSPPPLTTVGVAAVIVGTLPSTMAIVWTGAETLPTRSAMVNV